MSKVKRRAMGSLASSMVALEGEVLTYALNLIWKASLLAHQAGTLHIPEVVHSSIGLEPYALKATFVRAYSAYRGFANAIVAGLRKKYAGKRVAINPDNPIPREVVTEIRSWERELAIAIESDPSLFDEIQRFSSTVSADARYIWMNLIVHYVRSMLRWSKKEYLVGTRGGVLTFVKITRPIASLEDLGDLWGGEFAAGDLCMYGPSDLVVMPAVPVRYGVLKSWMKYEVTRDWARIIRDIWEHAYYNQCYILNPAGSRVKLLDVTGFDELVIRLVASTTDPNQPDIQVLFSGPNGGKLFTICSDILVNNLLYQNLVGVDEVSF